MVAGIITVPNSESVRPLLRGKKEGKFNRFKHAETWAEIRLGALTGDMYHSQLTTARLEESLSRLEEITTVTVVVVIINCNCMSFTGAVGTPSINDRNSCIRNFTSKVIFIKIAKDKLMTWVLPRYHRSSLQRNQLRVDARHSIIARISIRYILCKYILNNKMSRFS